MLFSLSDADKWINPDLRSLRAYQRFLVEGKLFGLLIDGKRYELRSSVALGGCNCLLLVDPESLQEFVLKSSGAGQGYCLSGQPLLSLEGGPNAWPSDPQGPAIVRTGCRNFAHFIWNEFDPLLELIEQNQSFECHQDVNSIFDLTSLPGLNQVGLHQLSKRPSVRLGSMLVTHRVRAHLHDAYGVLDRPSECIRPQTLLLGLRGPGKRSIQNELEFFSRLLVQLQPWSDQIKILFDGITLQNDRGGPLVGEIQSRIAACDSMIQKLGAQAGSIPFVNLNGLEFSEWLSLASSVDFYITHEGTMQHKLAWIFPSKVGLCLIGRKNAASIAKWHQNQSQDSSVVYNLPPELVELGDIPDHCVNERDRMFRIVDVDQSVQYVLDLVQQTCGLAQV